MLDQLGRPLRDLRISVTDRCNLRCPYCMPKDVFGPGFAFLERSELLSFEEITLVARKLADRGVVKLRLTGGEPLLRRELERLVEMLAGIDGIDEIALTTNGLLLGKRARTLADAGLSRVTVSLDALDRETLTTMSGTPLWPERVLEAIDVAAAAGLEPVKVNMVVRRGFNDHRVLAMAERFRHSGHILRFIEYMDVGSSNGWQPQDVVAADEILAVIGRRWPLEALAATREGEVASRYRYSDGAGEIGLIHSVTKPFCGGCTRARLSADGKLYTCLFATGGHDLRALLRADDGERRLDARLAEIWGARADRYSAERSELSRSEAHAAASAARIEMSYIGG
ncbi:MAG TPA: GTP 3',8-cyclase MoaA [Solirubrobacteraceae bacterium]|nr:GTP 3',8-cyclase MoaA [Solirubrobacteraceae bacterium]